MPLKPLTQPDNIQSHLMQQEAHYLQQKQMINPLYNGGYPHIPPLVHDSQFQGQYPSKHGDINTFSHVQQGINNQYDQKTMFDHINKHPDYAKQPQYSPNSTSSSNSKELKINEQEYLPEFAATKSDPKYQTLPYNTKFPQNSKLKSELISKGSNDTQESKSQNQNSANINVNHMTVHSTPLSIINKSLATPLSQNEAAYQQEPNTYQLQKSDSSSKCNEEGKENHSYPNNRLSNSNESSRNGGKNQQGNAIKGGSPSIGSSNTTGSSSIGFGVS